MERGYVGLTMLVLANDSYRSSAKSGNLNSLLACDFPEGVHVTLM
jgi:hypothetical protein